MPKLATPLTDIQVKNSKPKEKTWTLADGNGLYLEITPAGKKSWRMAYRRPITKKNNRLSFGDYPLIGLAEARAKCLAASKLLKDGIDPAAERDEKKQLAAESAAHTFEKIAREWHSTRLSAWSAATAKDTINRLEKDIFPEIGKLPISEVTHKQMIAALRKIEERGAGEVAH
ncbi:tyrosine-type recombinase/integrase [Undibacterium sp. RuRC25W]|uniref:tyrosine-type recombinase/integrase n=1 Tax=Undibacterium sp. RuRC25W TaxID=3413047 RepID=UPI003BF0FD75